MKKLRRYMQRHPIGTTMLSVVLLALVLSLLPLPDQLQPFPSLTSEPKRVVLGALWPRSAKAPAQPVAPTLDELTEDGDAVASDDGMVLPELDFSDEGAKPKETTETPARRVTMSAADEKEGRKWETLMKRVDAIHLDVEEPCIEQSRDGVCVKTALYAFTRAVRELREGRATQAVRVVTLGTSLIASDHITDVTRRRLQSRHGSAGLGYMYVDRPTRGAGRTVRSGTATEGWQIDKLTDQQWSKQLGMAGVGYSAGVVPQSTVISLQGARTAELYLLTQPNGGDVEVRVDGKPVAEVSTAADGLHAATSLLELPQGKEIQLRTAGGPVRLDGIALETGKPGMVFDSLGLPGGTAGVFIRANEELFIAQLAQRRPALVILMMGGNEAFDLSQKRYSLPEAKANFVKLLERVRRAAPQASCLMASPPDAGIWKMDNSIQPRKETAQVAAFMHDLAFRHGCAFWDMQQAMGGEGAIEKWWNNGLMNRDLVHPIGIGGDVFGYMLDSAIERARVRNETTLAARHPRWLPSREVRRWVLKAAPDASTPDGGTRRRSRDAGVVTVAPKPPTPAPVSDLKRPADLDPEHDPASAGTTSTMRDVIETQKPKDDDDVATRDARARETAAREMGVKDAGVSPAARDADAEARYAAGREALAREAREAAAQQKAAKDAAAAEKALADKAAREAAGRQQAADRAAAAEKAAADKAARELAAKEAAQKAAAEKAEKEAAARDAREQLAREAKEAAAREAAARAAKEQAAKDAREAAAREAKEAAQKLAAEKAAKELAAKEAKEAAIREAKENAAEALAEKERLAREAKDAAAKEAMAKDIAAREAKEAALKEQVAREAKELAARQEAAKTAASRDAGSPLAKEILALREGPLGSDPMFIGDPYSTAADAGVPKQFNPALLGADGAPTLRNPEALARFFKKLQTLETTRTGRISVVQIGASHTAAQFFTDSARDALAQRFGYAGRGFVAAGKSSDRLNTYGVTRTLDGGWQVYDALKSKVPNQTWGLTGIRAVARPRASMSVNFEEPGALGDDTSRIQIFLQEQPGMGQLEISVNGRVEKAIPSPAAGALSKVRVVEIGAPGGWHEVKVTNTGPGEVSLFGVSHELVKPGVVYDALGLPGSTAMTFASYEQEALAAQLRARQPDLFVLFFGTNEAALSAEHLEQVRQAYPRVIATLRSAAPDAACVFLGPTDRMSKKKKTGTWEEARSMDGSYNLVKEVAAYNGCAFWATRDVMGGEGSIERWRKLKPPLANKDHVHLTREGYHLLANDFIADLLLAYHASKDKEGSP